MSEPEEHPAFVVEESEVDENGVRILRNVKLLYVSIDSEPGPYGGTIEVVTPDEPHGEDDTR